MTKEQIKFISENEQHFMLVLDHAQNFQRGNDTQKVIIKMAEGLEYTDRDGKKHEAGAPIDHCTTCEQDAVKAVWEAYQLTKPKAKK